MDTKMLLVIDIGNTSMRFGIFHDDQLKEKFTIKSNKNSTVDDLGVSIHQYFSLFQLDSSNIENVILASVVPSLTETLTEAIKKYLDMTPHVIGQDLIINLDSSKYNNQAGIDRLINIYGGIQKHGKPLIIIDIGTAMTIDVADGNGSFIGGAIFPGIHSLNKALSNDTAKLPIVDIRKPDHVIGNSTEECILSGVYFGYINAIDGIINKMKAELDSPATVIATGGYSNLLQDCKNIDIFDNDLTLKSIKQIFLDRFK